MDGVLYVSSREIIHCRNLNALHLQYTNLTHRQVHDIQIKINVKEIEFEMETCDNSSWAK